MTQYISILEQATAATSNKNSWLAIILYVVFFIAVMYFMMIRPQKKQAEKAESLQNSIEVGDNIMTTSGFYGTILDVVDETTVIVEFGNNKNCRIPMHKKAIAEVEKAGTAEAAEEEIQDKKDTKKK